mmetsp:Transcript_78094/g.178694  ORF Transcript_78094/g.178694 Transcript_78094/m.178694 type:complete len:359 (+) Transcript_78094:785-1861(+)
MSQFTRIPRCLGVVPMVCTAAMYTGLGRKHPSRCIRYWTMDTAYSLASEGSSEVSTAARQPGSTYRPVVTIGSDDRPRPEDTVDCGSTDSLPSEVELSAAWARATAAASRVGRPGTSGGLPCCRPGSGRPGSALPDRVPLLPPTPELASAPGWSSTQASLAPPGVGSQLRCLRPLPPPTSGSTTLFLRRSTAGVPRTAGAATGGRASPPGAGRLVPRWSALVLRSRPCSMLGSILRPLPRRPPTAALRWSLLPDRDRDARDPFAPAAPPAHPPAAASPAGDAAPAPLAPGASSGVALGVGPTAGSPPACRSASGVTLRPVGRVPTSPVTRGRATDPRGVPRAEARKRRNTEGPPYTVA